jgi:hypothetical protein
MKTRIIKDQKEFDTIKRVEADEEIIFESEEIEINCRLQVFGILRLIGKIKSSWNDQYIEAWENSTPHIEAWENSTPHIEAWGNSTPYIVARGNSTPYIVARENSAPNIEAWENSAPHIEAWGNSTIHGMNLNVHTLLNLFGFSMGVVPFNLKLKIKKSKQAIIQRVKPQGWFERNNIAKKEKVILYKRVSEDFKTQENTSNETLWTIGSIVEHSAWNPKDNECGEGKFHACSRPYFCDEFRNQPEDRYIAIQIFRGDLFEWKNNPEYLYKIGFRKGTVIYECDRYGKKIEVTN